MVTRGRASPLVGAPAGHSLPELVVALTFLGASLTAMASAAVLASRWTGDAVDRQRALTVAEAVLDSLLELADPPEPGSAGIEAWTAAWAVDSAGTPNARVVEVAAGRVDRSRPAVRVLGLWVAPLWGPLP
jgi:Tfp pilus assembly protein PilV